MAHRNPDRVYSDAMADWLILGDELGRGGSGAVRAVIGDLGHAVKLMDQDKLFEDFEDTMGIVREVTDGVRGVAVVKEIVRDHPCGTPLGYVLERINGIGLENMRFKSTADRKRAAFSAAVTFDELAQRRAVQSDAHFGNQLLIRTRAGLSMVLIDVDSFSVGPVRWPDGSIRPRYFQSRAPGYGPAEYNRGEEIAPDERIAGYLLAEIVYRVLKDYHPRQVMKGNDQVVSVSTLVSSRIRGRFDREVLACEGASPIDKGIPWVFLPHDVRFMLERTLGDGWDNPAARVTPADFRAVLSDWCRIDRRKLFSFARTHKKKLMVGGGLGAACAIGAWFAGASSPTANVTVNSTMRSPGLIAGPAFRRFLPSNTGRFTAR